jgi:hypothetical protein
MRHTKAQVPPVADTTQSWGQLTRSTSVPSLLQHAAVNKVNAASSHPLERLRLNPENVDTLIRNATGSAVNTGQAEMDQKLAPPLLTRGMAGELVAAAHGAEAVSIGRHIFSHDGVSPAVLLHEYAHVAQSQNPGPIATRPQLEIEATRAATQWPGIVLQLRAPLNLPLYHPAVRVLLRAGRWLATRTVKTLSKHVARHGRRIAGRAIHSVFKDPKKIKKLVTSAVDDGVALARKHATKGADEVLEEGGVRIVRQGTRSPGKYRFVVEKNFGRAIGTSGETIIRVVLDMSGRVVTAFPVREFLGGAAGVIAVDIFTEKTAEAAEQVRAEVEAVENQPINWGEVALELVLDVASLGLLASTPANEGEDLIVRTNNLVWQAAQETILEVEQETGITLTQEQKDAIYEMAQAAIGAPMMFDEMEAEAESGDATAERDDTMSE